MSVPKPSLAYPKPTYKKDLRKRKRDRKKKDREIQEWANKQICWVENCYNQAVAHHVKPRRYLKTRHNTLAAIPFCVLHHTGDLGIHALGVGKFLRKYPVVSVTYQLRSTLIDLIPNLSDYV